jgi:isopenicillin N synthase-like dioxygenase
MQRKIYINFLRQRYNTRMTANSLPVMDLAPILGPYKKIGPEQYDKVARDLGEAMSGVGFAYLVNHGVDLTKVYFY